MRVLLGVDGSEQSELATDLLAGITWPPDSAVRAVTVVESARQTLGAPLAAGPPVGIDRLDQELTSYAESVLETAARRLARTGARFEREVLRGRPASAIIGDAAEWRADLVVVGSRGHGAIASMLLGSVGAEIVDQAPCPVLVARARTTDRILLAHDGSGHAMAAEELLRSWPILARSAIDVASVAHVETHWQVGLEPSIYSEAVEVVEEARRALVDEHRQVADAAVRRLRDAGLHANPSVAIGSPAAELIKLAAERQADTIVMGTHGRTGIARVFLGSVARSVLNHAPVSVLVARAGQGSGAE